MEREHTIFGENQREKLTAKPRKGSRRRHTIIVIVISILNLGLLALLLSQLLTPAQQQNQDNVYNTLVGHTAPNFTLAMLSSRTSSTIHLGDFKGKPVVLNFWASWCDPCNSEAPLFQSDWQQVQRKGTIFIGIDYQDSQNDGLAFLKKYGITYLNVIDPNGSTAINYGIAFTPSTIFINRHGVVVNEIQRELTEQDLQSNLQMLL